MSDPQAQPEQQAIGYMVQLLQMNPLQEGDEIIRARGNSLGLAKKGVSTDAAVESEPRVERRTVVEQLESIRDQFWTLPIDVLNSQLNEFNSRGFADIESAITRLRFVATHRAAFPKLADKKGFDSDFFSSFKEVLVRSPRDSVDLREQVLSSFGNSSRRKRGRRMVNLVKSDLPAIYQLEADWLNALYRQKVKMPDIVLYSRGHRTDDLNTAGSSWTSNWWVYWILLMIAVRAIAALMGGQ